MSIASAMPNWISLAASCGARGKVVELSALEFKLLSAFVKRAGRLLTRTQLLDEVWGRDTHVTDRVVDNQVTTCARRSSRIPTARDISFRCAVWVTGSMAKG